jgi:hypothetical protein
MLVSMFAVKKQINFFLKTRETLSKVVDTIWNNPVGLLVMDRNNEKFQHGRINLGLINFKVDKQNVALVNPVKGERPRSRKVTPEKADSYQDMRPVTSVV